MVGWFKRFFCSHQWEVLVNTQAVLEKGRKGVVIVQRCKKCGKIQKDIIRYA